MRLFLVAALLVVGCEAEEAPRLSNRPRGRGIGTGAGIPAPAIEDPDAPRARRSRERGDDESAQAPAQPEQPPPEQAREERDLSAELARAFGTPTGCISQPTRDRLEGTLRISVQVNVSLTGVVTRASVSGSQLSPEDRECLTRHAERVRIPGPIPNAPRSISATVEYSVASVRPTAREEYPRAAPIPGNVAPDRTLPAAGSEQNRPPGSLPPDRTLPAGGTEQNRPPGFVPPSQTLPAQVN